MTGERYVPNRMNGLIEIEHLHRYSAAKILCQNHVVLDVASGEGYGSCLLSQISQKVIGIEVDFGSVQHACLTYANKCNNLFYLNAEATHLPIKTNSVDVITSFETIEHIHEQKAMMLEFVRVLNDDGILIVSTPNKAIYSDAAFYQNPYHIKEFEKEEFRQFLGNFFVQVEIYRQSIVCPSIILPERVKGNPTLVMEAGGGADILPFDSAEFNSTYFVAVCSNRARAMPKLPQSSLINRKWVDLHSTMIEMHRLRQLIEIVEFSKPVEKFNLPLDDTLHQAGFEGLIEQNSFKGSLEVHEGKDWTGWAVRSDVPVPAELVLVSDDNITMAVTPHLPRPDVARHIGSLGALMSGFTLPVDYAAQLDRSSLRAVAYVKGYGAGDLNIL